MPVHASDVPTHKTDLQLQQDVEAELRWDPRVNAARIAVTVDRGAVSLLGAVDTYPEKWAAEDATKRVGGVRAVAQDLAVTILEDHRRSDAEIAAAVLRKIKSSVVVPRTVAIKVEGGAVTLAGVVHWNFQREEAERAVRHLAGVVAVYNAITLHPMEAEAGVQESVEAALARRATGDVHSIRVEAVGGQVTLTGHAWSWQVIEDAVNAAWAAEGVTHVVNLVTMSPAN